MYQLFKYGYYIAVVISSWGSLSVFHPCFLRFIGCRRRLLGVTEFAKKSSPALFFSLLFTRNSMFIQSPRCNQFSIHLFIIRTHASPKQFSSHCHAFELFVDALVDLTRRCDVKLLLKFRCTTLMLDYNFYLVRE